MIRIYYPKELIKNIQLQEERHYIVNVHRLNIDDQFSLFNTKEGEFIFQIEKIDSDFVYCTKIEQVHCQEQKQKISVALPMIKLSRLEWAIEKCTEIGVNKIYLLHTHRTIKRGPDFRRLSKIVCAALQQSMRVCLPELIGPISLEDFLNQAKNVVLGDASARPVGNLGRLSGECTLLIGPEGGFEDVELEMLRSVRKISFVPDSILRTETAAVAGLSILKQQNR